MENTEKTISYNESDIQKVIQMLDGLVVQGLNNIQIISAISQILLNKRTDKPET